MTNYDFGTILLFTFPHTNLKRSSKRSALVIYDGKDNDIVVARVTSQSCTSKTDYEFTNWRNAGLLYPS